MFLLLRRAKEGLEEHLGCTFRPCLLIDDDPQGSLTLWNELRAESALPLKIVKRGITHIVEKSQTQRSGMDIHRYAAE